jgi:hypothetical protein
MRGLPELEVANTKADSRGPLRRAAERCHETRFIDSLGTGMGSTPPISRAPSTMPTAGTLLGALRPGQSNRDSMCIAEIMISNDEVERPRPYAPRAAHS